LHKKHKKTPAKISRQVSVLLEYLKNLCAPLNFIMVVAVVGKYGPFTLVWSGMRNSMTFFAGFNLLA